MGPMIRESGRATVRVLESSRDGLRWKSGGRLVPAVLVHSVLSVLRVVAEVQEAALIEYPKAEHRGSPSIGAIHHLLLVAAVAHHDIKTAA